MSEWFKRYARRCSPVVVLLLIVVLVAPTASRRDGSAHALRRRGRAAVLVAWLVANAVLPNGAPLGVVLLGVVSGPSTR